MSKCHCEADAATEASWSRIRPSPSSIVSRVSRENSMLTVSVGGSCVGCSHPPLTWEEEEEKASQMVQAGPGYPV